MKAAIYTRVSTEEQAREGYSLAAQEKVLCDYCKLKNIEVVEVYSDEGISAGTMIKRPAMLRMLKDAKEQKFDVILVWKLTRFSRNLKDILNACDDLEKYGVYLQSFSENFDGKTPAGRLMRGVIGLMGQFEREVLSENVVLGLTERAHGGARTCSQLLGYDVIKGGSMTVNKVEAEIVKFIFSSYLKCKNLTKVAALCREKGYRGKRGRKFDAFKIEVVLTRFVYAGFYNWHNKPLKGDFESIISVKTYNKAQQLLKSQGSIIGRSRKHELVFLQ